METATPLLAELDLGPAYFVNKPSMKLTVEATFGDNIKNLAAYKNPWKISFGFTIKLPAPELKKKIISMLWRKRYVVFFPLLKYMSPLREKNIEAN